MKKRSRKTRLERQKLQRTTRKEKSPAEITIEIYLPSSKIANTVYTSLLPETRQLRGFRSRTTVSPEGSILRLNIKAEDIVALRAASNAFLKLVSVATKSLNIVAPFYSATDRDSDREATGKIV